MLSRRLSVPRRPLDDVRVLHCIIWFWILIYGLRRHLPPQGHAGVAKVLWIVFVILVPYLGVFVYLIANHDGMAERNIERAQAEQQATDHTSSPSPEVAVQRRRSRRRRVSSTRRDHPAEFDAIKAKALAAS